MHAFIFHTDNWGTRTFFWNSNSNNISIKYFRLKIFLQKMHLQLTSLILCYKIISKTNLKYNRNKLYHTVSSANTLLKIFMCTAPKINDNPVFLWMTYYIWMLLMSPESVLHNITCDRRQYLNSGIYESASRYLIDKL